MQEQLLQAADPGRRPAQQFVGVDLRRPKGYAAPSQPPAAAATATATAADAEPCPRCESRDTKFCYYNNYNTSQPRHFCKGCRRYWTKGGTLRNVPVGGGTRKKPSSSSTAKRQKPSKKRRVEAAPEPAVAASIGAVTAAPETTTPPADAASETTTELVVPAVEEDSFTDLLQQDDDGVVALGFSDFHHAAGKGLGDLDSFAWPPAFDMGACWSGAGFADTDPGMFLNHP